MSLRITLAAFMVMAAMGASVRAEPIDCATMPMSMHGAEDATCSVAKRFDFDAFHVTQHYKEMSVPPSVIPGQDARGVIHEMRGQGPAGEMLYAALARADNRTNVRYMNDLEAWAGQGWLPWRRGEDSGWSATATFTTAAGKWYVARFTWLEQRCQVILRYAALHGNGYRFAVIAAACRAGAAYGKAEAMRLADSVRIKQAPIPGSSNKDP